MVQKLTWGLGALLIILAAAGSIPATLENGAILGIFNVDPLHTIIYLLTGILAFAAAWKSSAHAQLYCKAMGVLYALFVLIGITIGGAVVGLSLNGADDVLHFIIAVLALWIGFAVKESVTSAAAAM